MGGSLEVTSYQLKTNSESRICADDTDLRGFFYLSYVSRISREHLPLCLNRGFARMTRICADFFIFLMSAAFRKNIRVSIS